ATNDQQNLFKFSIGFIVVNFLTGLGLLFLGVLLFPAIRKTDFWEMSQYILVVAFLLALTQLFSKYISIKKRIVVPNIFENVVPKIGMVIAFMGFVFWRFTELKAIWLFVSFFVLALIGMFFYLNRLEKLTYKIDFSFLKN